MTLLKNIALYVSIMKLVSIMIEINQGQTTLPAAGSLVFWTITYLVLDAIIND